MKRLITNLCVLLSSDLTCDAAILFQNYVTDKNYQLRNRNLIFRIFRLLFVLKSRSLSRLPVMNVEQTEANQYFRVIKNKI